MNGTSTDTTVVEARAVSLSYGARTILQQLDLTIRRGDFWFLLGNNGQGKSTFVHALLGHIEPSEGELRLNSSLADRKKVGFVPQRCDLNPSLPTTVREFVRLGLVGLDLPPRSHDREVAAALALVDLEVEMNRSYWALSGGQRQRALLARALVRRPELLIMDEPTSALDYALEASLYETLGRLNRDQHMTIVLVTHDLHVAALRASHVALFRNGSVLAGERNTIMTKQHIRTTFGVDIPGIFP